MFRAIFELKWNRACQFLKRHFTVQPKFYFLYLIMALYSIGVFEAHALWRAEMRTPKIKETLKHIQKLSYEDLSDSQLEILLRVEDPTFFRHRGMDLSSPGQGISTLSQALVRRIYFDTYREGFSKLEQTLVALNILDWHFTKREQITAFLNVAYFGSYEGETVRGFSTAAETYMKKSFFELDHDEYVGLVAMLAAPNKLDPIQHPRAYRDRVQRIKRLLAGHCKTKNLLDTFFRSCGTTNFEEVYDF